MKRRNPGAAVLAAAGGEAAQTNPVSATDGGPIVEPSASETSAPGAADVEASRPGLSDVQNAVIYALLVLIGIALIAIR